MDGFSLSYSLVRPLICGLVTDLVYTSPNPEGPPPPPPDLGVGGYLRPDEISRYLRPDATSGYLRPDATGPIHQETGGASATNFLYNGASIWYNGVPILYN